MLGFSRYFFAVREKLWLVWYFQCLCTGALHYASSTNKNITSTKREACVITAELSNTGVIGEVLLH